MAGKNVLKPKPKERNGLSLKGKFDFKVPDSAKTVMGKPKEIISGDILNRGEPTKWINILLFLTVLGFLYIYNNYQAEEKIRKIHKREKYIKELRYQYIITKSKLMTLSRQTEVQKRLEPKGYKENKEPLKVIKVNKDLLEAIKK